MWISPLRNYSRIAATLKRFLQLLLSQLDSQSLTQSSCKPPTWQHWEWAATPALDQPSSAGIHRTASLTSFRQGLTQEGWLMLSSSTTGQHLQSSRAPNEQKSPSEQICGPSGLFGIRRWGLWANYSGLQCLSQNQFLKTSFLLFLSKISHLWDSWQDRLWSLQDEINKS